MACMRVQKKKGEVGAQSSAHQHTLKRQWEVARSGSRQEGKVFGMHVLGSCEVGGSTQFASALGARQVPDAA